MVAGKGPAVLEILVLIFLCKQVGTIARERDRKPFWYQVMMIAMWIGGEMLGGIIAFLVNEWADSGTDPSRGTIYLFALVGAVAGAAGAFAIVKSRRPPEEPRGFPVVQPVPPSVSPTERRQD